MNWIRGIRDIWLIIGITILLFLALECVFFVAAVTHCPYDTRADLPVYKDFEERLEFWVEHDRALVTRGLSYVPYHMWTRRPFSGRWTNIDANGDRATCYSADKNLKGVKKIFMFGGSTLWGTGAPDCETIPSYISKLLNKDKPQYVVYNYAETGYVASQELNRLISEIKKGHIPDLVIFYSGINDAFEGTCTLGALKTPAYHTYMDRFGRVFKQSKTAKFFEILEMTYIYRGFNFIKNRLFPNAVERWEETIEEETIQEAAHKTAQYWVANYEIASKIGREYGFKVILILQPNAASGGKILQDYEKNFLKGSHAAVNVAYEAMKGIIRENNFSGVCDLSDIFENINEPIYIDWAHMGPLGNYYVASRIAEIIKAGGYLK